MKRKANKFLAVLTCVIMVFSLAVPGIAMTYSEDEACCDSHDVEGHVHDPGEFGSALGLLGDCGDNGDCCGTVKEPDDDDGDIVDGEEAAALTKSDFGSLKTAFGMSLFGDCTCFDCDDADCACADDGDCAITECTCPDYDDYDCEDCGEGMMTCLCCAACDDGCDLCDPSLWSGDGLSADITLSILSAPQGGVAVPIGIASGNNTWGGSDGGGAELMGDFVRFTPAANWHGLDRRDAFRSWGWDATTDDTIVIQGRVSSDWNNGNIRIAPTVGSGSATVSVTPGGAFELRFLVPSDLATASPATQMRVSASGPPSEGPLANQYIGYFDITGIYVIPPSAPSVLTPPASPPAIAVPIGIASGNNTWGGSDGGGAELMGDFVRFTPTDNWHGLDRRDAFRSWGWDATTGDTIVIQGRVSEDWEKGNIRIAPTVGNGSATVSVIPGRAFELRFLVPSDLATASPATQMRVSSTGATDTNNGTFDITGIWVVPAGSGDDDPPWATVRQSFFTFGGGHGGNVVVTPLADGIDVLRGGSEPQNHEGIGINVAALRALNANDRTIVIEGEIIGGSGTLNFAVWRGGAWDDAINGSDTEITILPTQLFAAGPSHRLVVNSSGGGAAPATGFKITGITVGGVCILTLIVTPVPCSQEAGHTGLQTATCVGAADPCTVCGYINGDVLGPLGHDYEPYNETHHGCSRCTFTEQHVFGSNHLCTKCGAPDLSQGPVTFTWEEIYNLYFASGGGHGALSVFVDTVGGIYVSGRANNWDGLGINVTDLRALGAGDIVITGEVIGGSGNRSFSLWYNGAWDSPNNIAGSATGITIPSAAPVSAGTTNRLIVNSDGTVAPGFRITGITVGGDSIVKPGQGSTPSPWAEVQQKFFTSGGNHGTLTVATATDGISVSRRVQNPQGLGINVAELRALNASDSTIVITGELIGGSGDLIFAVWRDGRWQDQIRGTNTTSITIPPTATEPFAVGTAHRLIADSSLGDTSTPTAFRITGITVGGVNIFTLMVNPILCTLASGHSTLPRATCVDAAIPCTACGYINGDVLGPLGHDYEPRNETHHGCSICTFTEEHVFGSNNLCTKCNAPDLSQGPVTFTWDEIFDMFFTTGGSHGTVSVDTAGGINVSGRTVNHQGLGINVANLRALGAGDIVITGTMTGGDEPVFQIWRGGSHTDVIRGDATGITIPPSSEEAFAAGTDHRLIINVADGTPAVGSFRITGITVGGDSIVTPGQGSGPSPWAEVRQKFFASGGGHGSMPVTSAADGINVRGRTQNHQGLGLNVTELRALNASDSTIVITGEFTGGSGDRNFALWRGGSHSDAINGYETSITIPPTAVFAPGTDHRLIVNSNADAATAFKITAITVGGVSIFELLVNPILCVSAGLHAGLARATCTAAAVSCTECGWINGLPGPLGHDYRSISSTQHDCRNCDYVADHTFVNNICTACGALDTGGGSATFSWPEILEMFFEQGGAHGATTVEVTADGIKVSGITVNHMGLGVNVAALRSLNDTDKEIVITVTTTGGEQSWGPRLEIIPDGQHWATGSHQDSRTTLTIPADNAHVNAPGTAHRLILHGGGPYTDVSFTIINITVGGVPIVATGLCPNTHNHGRLARATCLEPAGVCEVCGYFEGTVRAAPLGHSFTVYINPTYHECDRDGCGVRANHPVGLGEWCPLCDTTLPADGHSCVWGPVVSTTATCTAAGMATRNCTVAGCTITQTAPQAALGHTTTTGQCARCPASPCGMCGVMGDWRWGGNDGSHWAGNCACPYNAPHTFNANGVCTVCGFATANPPTACGMCGVVGPWRWGGNDTHHWAANCACPYNAPHTFNASGVCTVCGFVGQAPDGTNTACPICGVTGPWRWGGNETHHWADNCNCTGNAPHEFDADGRCICGATRVLAPQEAFREEDFIEADTLIDELRRAVEAGEVPTINLVGAGTVTIISADVFLAIAEMGVDVVVVLPSGFTFTIIAASISADVGAFDLNIVVYVEHTVAQHTTLGGGIVDVPASSLVFKPNFHGDFGFDLVFNVTAEQLEYVGIDGATAKHFHVCAVGNVTEQVQPTYNAGDGSIDITFSHASFHILSNEEPVTVEVGTMVVGPPNVVDETPGTTTPGNDPGNVVTAIQDAIAQQSSNSYWLLIIITSTVILASAVATIVMLKRRQRT